MGTYLLGRGFRIAALRFSTSMFHSKYGNCEAEGTAEESEYYINEPNRNIDTKIEAACYEKQAYDEPELRNAFIDWGR